MEIIEQEVLRWTSEVYNTMGWPGVSILMAIESVFFPIPSEIVMPLAGWMLIADQGKSVWHILVAGLFGASGSLLGALSIYAVGFFGGRGIIERYGHYFFISKNDLNVADEWFEKYGTWAVFISRLIPVVRSLISLPAGITKMRLIPFIVLTFAGSFIWSAGLALGGFILGSSWENMRGIMRPFDLPIIVTISCLMLGYLLYKLASKRKKKTH
jgi:membrane protein DedA with SNARE-associated domain